MAHVRKAVLAKQTELHLAALLAMVPTNIRNCHFSCGGKPYGFGERLQPICPVYR